METSWRIEETDTKEQRKYVIVSGGREMERRNPKDKLPLAVYPARRVKGLPPLPKQTRGFTSGAESRPPHLKLPGGHDKIGFATTLRPQGRELRKRMKKTLCLLIVCLLLTLPVSAGFSLAPHRFDKAGLELSLPAGDRWVLLTPDVQEGDPAIDFFGADLETLQKTLRQADICFEAVTRDQQQEITVIVSRGRDTRRTFNYADVGDEELLRQGQAYVEQDFSEQSPGLDYLSCELAPSGDLLYLRFAGQVVGEASDSRFVQYITIYNGWMVNIALHSFDGQMSAEHEQLIAGIASSLRFDAALSKWQDAQRYIDAAVTAGVMTLAVLSAVWLFRRKKPLKQQGNARKKAEKPRVVDDAELLLSPGDRADGGGDKPQ